MSYVEGSHLWYEHVTRLIKNLKLLMTVKGHLWSNCEKLVNTIAQVASL